MCTISKKEKHYSFSSSGGGGYIMLTRSQQPPNSVAKHLLRLGKIVDALNPPPLVDFCTIRWNALNLNESFSKLSFLVIQ